MAAVSDQGDDRDDVRWMTYAELGRVRGISTASATRLAFRRKWQRQGGNDGTARVAVPVSEAHRQPERTHDDRDDDRGDVKRLIMALEAAISASGERAKADAETIEMQAALIVAERNRADAEAGRADRAEAARGAAIALADQTVALLKDAVDRAQQLAREAGRSVEAAQMAQAEAEADAAELRQAEAARKGGGLLARLRAALRGE
jgi:hypothetical protein